MNNSVHTMTDLFLQLGLPADGPSIAAFIEQHAGACQTCALPYATIWTDSQRAFLTEAISEDSDWAIPAEQLTGLLSECGPTLLQN